MSDHHHVTSCGHPCDEMCKNCEPAIIRQSEVNKIRADLAAATKRAEEAERERDVAQAEVRRWHRDGTALAGELWKTQTAVAELTKRAEEAERERDEARARAELAEAAVQTYEGKSAPLAAYVSREIARGVTRSIRETEDTLVAIRRVLAERLLGTDPSTIVASAVAKALDAKARDLATAHALAADLVVALPSCDACEAPATRAWKRGEGRWCDEHAPSKLVERDDGHGFYRGTAPQYPRAAPLRALVAALPPGALDAARERAAKR